MKNTIYFMGTHGCGKTTTIDTIQKQSDSSLFLSSDGDHGNPYVEPFQRQVWRLNKYYLDALKIKESQNNLNEQSLLVDRCLFDHEAYTKTFHQMGWLSENQYKKIEELRKVYFDDASILPKDVVLFFPPEEWTIARIKQRWNEEKKKWNEGDFDYLHFLREQYFAIYTREKENRQVLLVEETDLEMRVKQITDFISKP